jgi:hypothetical protein
VNLLRRLFQREGTEILMHEAIPFAAELEERTDRVIEPVVVLDLALREDPEVVPGHAAAFRRKPCGRLLKRQLRTALC